MKPTHILTVLLLALLPTTPSVAGAESSLIAKTAPPHAGEAPIVSLAGKWRFALDRQGVGAEQRWFVRTCSLVPKLHLGTHLSSKFYFATVAAGHATAFPRALSKAGAMPQGCPAYGGARSATSKTRHYEVQLRNEGK